jgi:16S rRNA (cytosine967-C5)-methyltransferase
MRLGGRLAAAIEVLEDIDRRHRPAAEALKDWGLSHRFAGAGDRAAIGNIVYDALRRKRSACWRLDAETARAMAFGALLLEGGETPDSIASSINDDRFAPQPLSEAELRALDARDLATAPDAVRADCPDWAAPLLERSFGADWVEEGRALAARPPLDIRVNTLSSQRRKVLSELAETDAVATDLAPEGIRIPPIRGNGRHPNVQAEPAFQKGWFEVQDEGSQCAAVLAGASEGMQVLDLCAGAGGKTLALAAAMNNKGQIFAYDADRTRLAPIFDRLRRSDVRNVQVAARATELAPLKGRMDLVLIDAPCTGCGTWRRRPDAKWRLTQRQIDVRRGEQEKLLEEAAGYVKAGGRLVYVTCSVFTEENGDRVANFLAAHPGFDALDHQALFERHFPGKSGRARIAAGGGVLLSPARSGTDGFFLATMRRAG